MSNPTSWLAGGGEEWTFGIGLGVRAARSIPFGQRQDGIHELSSVRECNSSKEQKNYAELQHVIETCFCWGAKVLYIYI